ncbi:uncharacterized protein LOC144168741 isoform X2 [Haemaphysalis longicornis]
MNGSRASCIRAPLCDRPLSPLLVSSARATPREAMRPPTARFSTAGVLGAALIVLWLASVAEARVDASLKSRLLSEAGMREDRVRELIDLGSDALLRKKTHHHLIEKLGLPLVVVAKHMIPLWVAGTAAFLAVVLAHSPLSPLPVPPLPHAPVGRFPPSQSVLKVPAPVHIINVHHAQRRTQQRPPIPYARTQALGSLIETRQYVNLEKLLHRRPRGRRAAASRPPASSASQLMRPAAQAALNAVMRLQPMRMIRTAFAVSAVLRILRVVSSAVVGAIDA